MKFSPTSFQKWAILLVAIAAASAVLFAGLFARNGVLKANPCQMTYSKRDRTEVPLCGKNCEYKLWKVSHALSKKLNPQPVLYIPGHLGSAAQARSLASHMHNEDEYFQYFALDFNEGYSALHGGDILAQAYAANQALHQIQRLYKTKKNLAIGLEVNATRKIMIVGHSVGGMVARTMPLLSNHLACSVRDIVQLSTPNLRPPYSPDASLDATYALINRYWAQTYRNASVLPELCAHLPKYTNTSAQWDRRDIASGSVQLVCPTCIANMRLVSITGGDVELEVPAALSDLNSLFPAPAVPRIANSVAPRNVSVDGLLYGVVKKVFNYSVKKMIGLVGYGSGNNTGVANSTTSVVDAPAVVVESTSGVDSSNASSVDEAMQVVEVDVDAYATSAVVEEVPVAVDSSDSIDSAAESTPVDVVTTVSEGGEPIVVLDSPTAPLLSVPLAPSVQFVSLRSSQLKDVRFPVDHAAIVWCYDLVHSVTAGMRVLSKTNSSVYVDWNEVFPTVYNNTNNSSDVGSLVYHINDRRAAARQWLDATNSEYKYITNLLPHRYVTELPFAFVSHHLVKIVVCYLIVSLLVLFAPLLRILSGNADTEMSTNYDNILPWNHLSVDIVCAAVFSSLRSSVPPQFRSHVFTVVYQLAFLVLTLKGAYDYFFGTFSIAMYTNVVHWVVAYLLALLVRLLLLMFLQSVQNSSYGVYSVLRSVLRYTVWNQTIRRAVRGGTKSVHSILSAKLPFYSSCVATLYNSLPLLLVSAMWATVYVTSMDRVQSMNRITYGTSVLAVTTYIILVTGLGASVLLPTTTNKKATAEHTHYNTDLVLLYLPAPVLAFPTFYSAFRMLYAATSVYSSVSDLFGVLDTSRMCYVVAMGAIAAHVWIARSPCTLPSQVKPLRFLFELLGPHTLQAYVDTYGSTHTSSGGKSSGGGVDLSHLNTGVNSGANGCVHEDGGKNAIFEQITVDEQGHEVQKVAPNVTLGSTYKVVSCNCARDSSLNEIAEWCSWCKCRKCGGKHLPAASKARFNAHFSGLNATDLADFSMDLLPLFVLSTAVLLAVWYVGESPFLYLYALGAVAVGFVVREWSVAQK